MASSLQSNRGTLVLEGVSPNHYASPAPPHTNNLSGKISQWIAKLDKIPTVMFFSTTLVDFLDQAVQKFQETAKKFDQYVEKANKEEYVCLTCFQSRFRILSERMIWNLPLVSSVWVWEGIIIFFSIFLYEMLLTLIEVYFCFSFFAVFSGAIVRKINNRLLNVERSFINLEPILQDFPLQRLAQL